MYSGFLAGPDQVAQVIAAINQFAGEDRIAVVDPAMGDDGKLYPVFDDSIVEAMKKLVAHATLITPNYTEACLLTDTPLEGRGPYGRRTGSPLRQAAGSGTQTGGDHQRTL